MGAVLMARFWKLAGLAAIGAIIVAERARPLRRRSAAQGPRVLRNAAMGAACAGVIALSEAPLTERIARKNAAGKRGVQHLVGGPAGKLAALLVMDYSFYLWHVATHKVPFLWRFHRVHHVDPDCDASTAVRFHFLDMLLSLPWRLVQVRMAGFDPPMLRRWNTFFALSIAFHHSNWQLPGGWDERLSRLITTPRMHGIHHSRMPDEMDSNWTSGLSFWDRLHHTFRGNVVQEDIVIGVDDPDAAGDASLLPALLAPLRRDARR